MRQIVKVDGRLHDITPRSTGGAENFIVGGTALEERRAELARVGAVAAVRVDHCELVPGGPEVAGDLAADAAEAADQMVVVESFDHPQRSALLEQVSTTDLLTDPARLYQVADAATGSLTTDTGLDSLGELTDLGRSLGGLAADDVRTLTMPVLPAPTDPNRVVADEPDAGDLWESLR